MNVSCHVTKVIIFNPFFQETATLCSSIFSTQKLRKSIKKMATNLEEILETQRILLETKAAEKVISLKIYHTTSFIVE